MRSSELDFDKLYREAAEATARGSKSFYFASRFFPKELARAAHAVYWFCRCTDDIVDECSSIEYGRVELEEWSRQVECAFRGGPVAHPVLIVFLDAMQRHCIPQEYALELIEGMRMDLEGRRYECFADLRVFCYRVASVVGLMMSHVIGFRGEALRYATDLGIAMQLTNILRDIGEDLGRGRVYLPTDEMRRFGYSEEELRRHVRNAAFVDLMSFQVKRAREFYKAAMPGIALLSSDGRFAVKVAAEVYRGILDSIEASGYDVFERRAFVSPVRKYWITTKAMTLPVARSSLVRLGLWTS